MKKNRGKWRNSNCLLLGILIYSFLFWAGGGNINQAFGIIIVALMAFVLHRLENSEKRGSKIQSLDVIYLCVGIILDSLFKGFPLDMLLK